MSSRWPNKYVIGLTGNIAVGKSVARQMLQHLGAYTIDADGLTHQAMSPGAPAYKPIVDTFGQFIVGSDGRINRAALGNVVFSNPEALKKLENITHPIIRQAINTLVNRSKQRVIVIEAIKLLEGELAQVVDAIWVVNASPKTQYTRLIKKRKMSEADAKQRITTQSSQADKVKQASVVIQNDGNVEETWKQVQLQWSEIVKQLAPAATPPAPAKPEPKAAPAPPTPAPAAAPPTPAPAETAAPAPADTAEATSTETAPPAPAVDTSGVVVKRGMPNNAQLIADFITASSDQEVSRMDVMMSFGEKSYLVTQDTSDAVIAVIGWTVENLVTRMDEFYMKADAPIPAVVAAVVQSIEDASKELQSEVGFIFLPGDTSPETVTAFQTNGYESITLSEIKIPAWREAVEEMIANRDITLLWRQLRKDRVLQPI